MIKAHVILDNSIWKRKIKNPKKYFSEKLKKINLQVLKLVKQQRWYVFKTKGLKKNKITFNILLTDSLNMKRLNKRFRGKCKSTDVLSFPDYMPNSKFSTNLYERIDLLTEKSEGIFLGEIAIDYEIINSRSKGNNFLLEFDKAWIHGLLHLLGFDHKKNKDYIKMLKEERQIYKSVISKTK